MSKVADSVPKKILSDAVEVVEGKHKVNNCDERDPLFFWLASERFYCWIRERSTS